PLEQRIGHGMHLVGVVFDELARHGVLFVDDLADFGIDLLHGGLGDVPGLGHAATQEDLAFVLGIHHGPKRIGHAVTGDDVAGNGGGPFEDVGRAGGHLIHEDLFGDAPATQHHDHVQQSFLVHDVAVAFGQLHGDAQRPAARNDGDLVHRVGLGQQLGHQSVTGFVVRSVAALFFGHDHGTALGAHDDLVFRLFEVAHLDRAPVAPRREQG